MKKLLEFKTFIFIEAVLFVLYIILGVLRPVSIELPGTVHSSVYNSSISVLIWAGLVIAAVFGLYLLIFIVGRVVLYFKKPNL